VTTVEQITDVRDDFNRLRGRLFQFLESMGLPEAQTDAAKGMIRTLTYDSQARLEAVLRQSQNGRHP